MSCLHCWAQVLVNAGQANAATGDAGYEDCVASAGELANVLGISEKEVRSPSRHWGLEDGDRELGCMSQQLDVREVLQHVCMLELGHQERQWRTCNAPRKCRTSSGHQQCRGSSNNTAGAHAPLLSQVLLLSTGVIGRRIKLDALLASLPHLVAGLGASAEDAHHAAVAVTTTDLVSKSAALEVRAACLFQFYCLLFHVFMINLEPSMLFLDTAKQTVASGACLLKTLPCRASLYLASCKP